MTPVPTAQATLNLQSALRDVVRGGRRVLIVGCPPGTFTYWLTQHPSLVFWPSTEAKVSDDRKIVPAEIGAIVMTKMLSHALSGNVRHQAKERGLVCPADTFSPGAVMRLLEGVVDRPMKEGEHVAQRQDLKAVEAPLDEQTQALVDAIDEGIAALNLVRDQVITNGRQLAGVRDQLDALATLRKVLK